MKRFKISLILLIFSGLQLAAQDVFQVARTNDVIALEALLATAEIDVNQTDKRGFTPLILAVYNQSYEVAKLLLENGANPNAQDLSGNTALMGASFKAYPEMVDLLLAHKADVNLLNYNQAPALLFAATFGQLEIAKKLLEHGADKNLKDHNGKTALDHAQIQENEAMIQLLK